MFKSGTLLLFSQLPEKTLGSLRKYVHFRLIDEQPQVFLSHCFEFCFRLSFVRFWRLNNPLYTLFIHFNIFRPYLKYFLSLAYTTINILKNKLAILNMYHSRIHDNIARYKPTAYCDWINGPFMLRNQTELLLNF